MDTSGIVLPLLTAVFLFTAPAAARNRFPVAVDSVIRTGLGYSLSQQYDSAAAVFGRMAASDSTRCLGLFYRSVVAYTQLTDHEDYGRDSVFTAAVARAERAVRERIDTGGNAYDYYMAGTLVGYRGLLAIKKGNWIRGLRAGLKSMDLLETAVKADSSLTDAYWSLGIYRYYGGRLAEKFRWLPFVDADAAAGLDLVRRTVTDGEYAQSAAALALVWLYYDEGSYAPALALADSLLLQYPGNRMFMWPRGDILFAAQRNGEAVEQFRALLNALVTYEPDNTYHRALCRWKLTQLYVRTGDTAAARAQLDTLLALPMDGRTQERFQPFRKKALKLLEERQTADNRIR